MYNIRGDDPAKDIPFQKSKEEKLTQMIDAYDKEMLGYLGALYQSINKEEMDFNGIGNAVDALSRFNQKSEFNYLNNLLSPERCKGVKIPSPIPVPSCSFQLHNSITLSTNSKGVCALLFNPYFLASKNIETLNWPNDGDPIDMQVRYLTSLFINNDETLTGSEPNNGWQGVNISQQIPPVYDQYRLVSASIVIKYIGRLDIASGLIGGGIMFDQNSEVGGLLVHPGDQQQYNLRNFNLEKYGNFDLVMDSFYHQENSVLEGIRELYFPLDNSYEEYVRLCDGDHISVSAIPRMSELKATCDEEYFKSGFNFFAYTLNAPPSSACFKVDIYCNFECLPSAEFLNYMPLSLSVQSISPGDKKKAILQVQSRPITTSKETPKITNTGNWKTYWNEFAKKFSGRLPGVGKLLAKGLITAVPALKPAISLVGSMMGIENDF